MRFLLITPFMPSSSAKQAGHRLVFDTIKSISSTSEIDLLVILNKDEEIPDDLVVACRGKIIKIIIGRVYTIFNWLLYSRWCYPRFATRFSRSAASKIVKLCAEESYDIIRFEFSQTFIYGYFLRHYGVESEIIYSIHDTQFQVVLRKTTLEKYLCNWVRHTEKELLKKADRLEVLSGKDKTIVQSILDVGVDVVIKPIKLSDFVYKLAGRSDVAREKNSLLFWGAMNRLENESAIIDFIENILKPLNMEGMHYKLYVVGSGPRSKLLKYDSSQVVITGFIVDPSEFFLKASIGIVPLSLGSGVKLKTLEMLESGIPCVIATPVGAEGVSGYDDRLLIRDFDRIFSELAIRYIKN